MDEGCNVGHMTRFEPMTVQRFWWWYNKIYIRQDDNHQLAIKYPCQWISRLSGYLVIGHRARSRWGKRNSHNSTLQAATH